MRERHVEGAVGRTLTIDAVLTQIVALYPAENFAKMWLQFPVQRLPTTLGNEHNMIFAVPLTVA
jgi:hypothetical protein